MGKEKQHNWVWEGWENPVVLRKCIIRAGRVRNHRGKILHYEERNLQTWKRNFDRMKENGDQVPIVMDHLMNSENLLGYVTDMEVSGDELYSRCIFPDERCAGIAQRNEVSIGQQYLYRTGQGSYPDCIVHVATTPSGRAGALGPYMNVLSNVNSGEIKENTMDNLKAIADLVSLIYAEVIPEDVYEDEQKLFEWVRDRLQAALDAMKGDTTDDTDTAGAGEGGENDVLLSNTVRMLLEAQHAEFNTLLSNMTRSGKMTPHRANGLRHQFKVGRPMKEAYGALPALIGYMQAAKEQFSNTDGDGGFGRQSGTQTGSGGGGDIKPPAGFMKVMQARAAKQKRN